MQLPGKNFLKKSFLAATASVALAVCAVVPGPRGELMVEPVVPAPVYAAPAYPVYPVYPAPAIIIGGHHDRDFHRGWEHRRFDNHGWRR